jgi:hypothetical protein
MELHCRYHRDNGLERITTWRCRRGLLRERDDQRDAEEGEAIISRIGAKLSSRDALRQYIIVYQYIIMYRPW